MLAMKRGVEAMARGREAQISRLEKMVEGDPT
jgi:hypothetical protein